MANTNTTQNLNTDVSVVDYLKSIGQDSSFNARSGLATKYGIANYTGAGDQNSSLLSALKSSVAPKTTTEVKDAATATSFINANQQQDFKKATEVTEPPVKKSTASYDQIFKDLQATLSGGLGNKPTTVNFEQAYRNEMAAEGVTSLENTLNDLTNQENEIRATFRTQKANEQGKPVAMNVIEGRVSEEERAANERLDAVLRQKDYVSNQLKTKYSAIDTLMKYKTLDYNNATDAYDKQFSQNLQMFNTVKGIADTEKSDQDRQQDNARANAQIIYNSITSGGVRFDTLPADQKLQLQKLELQAGLPSGFYESLQAKNPKADIVTSTTRETGGKKYADIIMRDATGKLITQTMLLGNSTDGGNKPTEGDKVKADANNVFTQLKGRAGEDGYVAPEDYTKARKAWIGAGYTSKDFDERFGKDFVNPESYDAVNLSSSALN